MTQTGVQPAETSLWRNRTFLLLWTGQSLSLIGDWFFTATTMVWIITKLGRGQRWLPLAVSLVPLAATLPILLIGPLAGVFVDRWNPQQTMLITDLLPMVRVILFLLIILTLSDHTLL